MIKYILVMLIAATVIGCGEKKVQEEKSPESVVVEEVTK